MKARLSSVEEERAQHNVRRHSFDASALDPTQGLRSPCFEDIPSIQIARNLAARVDPRSSLCDEESSVPPRVPASFGSFREASGDGADCRCGAC